MAKVIGYYELNKISRKILYRSIYYRMIGGRTIKRISTRDRDLIKKFIIESYMNEGPKPLIPLIRRLKTYTSLTDAERKEYKIPHLQCFEVLIDNDHYFSNTKEINAFLEYVYINIGRFSNCMYHSDWLEYKNKRLQDRMSE